tara:strand:+ start:220 stop:675 length:456 start_codon:yes stop_codon:yes gene_type:complete
VKVRGNLLAFDDPNGRGQLGVQGGEPVHWIHSELGWRIEVGGLAGGMDPRVGSTRSVNPDWFLGDFLKGGFQAFLNSVATGLNLPPRKSKSVIGDRQLEAHKVFFSEIAPIGKDVKSRGREGGDKEAGGVGRPALSKAKEAALVGLPLEYL